MGKVPLTKHRLASDHPSVLDRTRVNPYDPDQIGLQRHSEHTSNPTAPTPGCGYSPSTSTSHRILMYSIKIIQCSRARVTHLDRRGSQPFAASRTLVLSLTQYDRLLVETAQIQANAPARWTMCGHTAQFLGDLLLPQLTQPRQVRFARRDSSAALPLMFGVLWPRCPLSGQKLKPSTPFAPYLSPSPPPSPPPDQ